ncbi:hypothetical protein TNIN_449881 [Trichonephila inaurata madagascariensis]|uniref:Uncharacterized protein n=1 Tax=Trichonephila inaurata madagascariensis TaxID=2747483 RepID=A0A8X6YVQ4_9ARAC|nr:hypothetical protein TNIN_449881 [Trichonephila inaurata madagascariensis]
MKQHRQKKRKYRRTISKVSTLEFKDDVLKKAEHIDSTRELVKERILCAYDLMTSEVKYLTPCYAHFLNRLPFIEKKPHHDNQVLEDMAENFNYIENHDDSQFTLKELRDALTDVSYSLEFAASYGNTVQYKISAVYHPQSRILSSESGSLVQYVGGNADINVHTLDGNNTLHVMGTKIVIPKDAVLYNDRV